MSTHAPDAYSVMSRRFEKDGLDFFPTPPWATRALIEHVLPVPISMYKDTKVLEPACGMGHMSEVLKEYFELVDSFDIKYYGYIETKTKDFIEDLFAVNYYDWVITNPPFNLAEEFIHKSLHISKRGCAMLVRTSFIESVGRYERLFSSCAPSIVAQFTERVPMHKGRLLKKGSTATAYAWLVWDKNMSSATNRSELIWIPPCRKTLERDSDYEKV